MHTNHLSIDSDDGFSRCEYCQGKPIVIMNNRTGKYKIRCSVCGLTTKYFLSKAVLMHYWNGGN